jgi:hypothetical protein
MKSIGYPSTTVSMVMALALVLFSVALLGTAHGASGPDYEVTEWSGPAEVEPGGAFTRTVVVTNVGDSGGSNPVRAEIRDVGAVLADVTSDGFAWCRDVDTYVTCNKAYLLPGQSASVTATFIADTSGTYTGFVKVIAPQDDEPTENNIASGVVTTVIGSPPPPPVDPVTVAVAGDVACRPGALVTSTACQQQAVGDLIRANNPDKVIVPGDVQYERGELANYPSYDAAFGSFKADTLAVPGNHDWLDAGAGGFGSYFDTSSPYWFSTDLGAWHVVMLDSNCRKIGGCGQKTPQGQWLKADLAADNHACTLAVWHHPKFNAGEHSGVSSMNWAWRALVSDGAELVFNGHDHNYQRWAPVDGLREFVIGTGGKSLYSGDLSEAEVGIGDSFGAGFFTLTDAGYSFEFKNLNEQVLDSGSGVCTP